MGASQLLVSRSSGSAAADGWSVPTASEFYVILPGLVRSEGSFDAGSASYGSGRALVTYTGDLADDGLTDVRTEPPRATMASVVPLHGPRERTMARFRMLRCLKENHDGEGAAAANSDSIDQAIAFLSQIDAEYPYFATLDDDGSAVLEFEDRAKGYFADIKFRADGTVECYRRAADVPSVSFEGPLNSDKARNFLKEQVGVVF